METIELQQVNPAVFSQPPQPHSDIWRTGAIFRKGSVYLIEADSGIGKTTLCSYLYGYRRDYSGMLLFDGADVRQLTIKQWSEKRRTEISALFQDLKLFPELTSLENINLKNELTKHKTHTQIDSLAERLGIAEKLSVPAAKLSFGQQQRVAFIRALCQPFDFLLLDEPVSHLDERNAVIMRDIIREELAATGAGAIITSIGRHFDMVYDKIMKL